MSRTALSRTLAALLAGALLLAPAALAAPRQPHTAAANGAALASPWSFLAGLWASFTRLWGEEGCSLDPSGRCAPAPVRPSTDNGCSLDPNGRCLAAPTVDNGCSLDPSGSCK